MKIGKWKHLQKPDPKRQDVEKRQYVKLLDFGAAQTLSCAAESWYRRRETGTDVFHPPQTIKKRAQRQLNAGYSD